MSYYNMINSKNFMLTDEGLYEPILNKTKEGRQALDRSRKALLCEKHAHAITWDTGEKAKKMHHAIFVYPNTGTLVYSRYENNDKLTSMVVDQLQRALKQTYVPI